MPSESNAPCRVDHGLPILYTGQQFQLFPFTRSSKANGFSGQILELLRYRGLLDRFDAASIGRSHPAPGFPFGGVQVDLTHLADPPLRVLGLPQPRLERLLDERAG
ncbi:MAG TPA: hypothetical protein VEO01_06375, partial [Pseudonocardiaceae bacterium]|nr:hypothetical protein [Pseudonocardiaceae bacterium]